MSGACEAAGIGHRISHDDDLPPPRERVIQAVELVASKLAQPSSQAGLEAVLLGQAMAVEQAPRAQNECPSPTGAIEKGSTNAFIGPDRRAIALAEHEPVGCEDCDDGPILQGCSHVWVNGLRWARRTDQLDCGALVGEGEPTIFLGAPAGERPPPRPVPQLLPAMLGDKLAGGDWPPS